MYLYTYDFPKHLNSKRAQNQTNENVNKSKLVHKRVSNSKINTFYIFEILINVKFALYSTIILCIFCSESQTISKSPGQKKKKKKNSWNQIHKSISRILFWIFSIKLKFYFQKKGNIQKKTIREIHSFHEFFGLDFF